MHAPSWGLGVGWRPELAWMIERRTDLGFVEVLAEDLDPSGPLPTPLVRLRERGVPIVLHGVGLSLGGADPPDPRRLQNLARLAERLETPLVSEHIAFVRAASLESGHLLPLPRDRDALRVLVENVSIARDALPVPLALENIATLVEWPEQAWDEAEFVSAFFEQADVAFLLDVENVYANCRNHGGDPRAMLDRLPLHRIAYLHVAGGFERSGIYHDTHTAPVPGEVLDLVEDVCSSVPVPGVMLERDGNFPGEAEFHEELDAIHAAYTRGVARWQSFHCTT